MKLIALLSIGFAAARVSSTPATTPTPTSSSAVAEVAATSDCTTSSVKLQQFNNNMTSTTYLKTRTKTREYDCNGCHHITTKWIGYRPPFHNQPTTVTVKKTTTTVAVCKTSPTPKPSKVLASPDGEIPENETQDVEISEIEMPENELPKAKRPEIKTQGVEISELEAQEFDIPEGVEVVDF